MTDSRHLLILGRPSAAGDLYWNVAELSSWPPEFLSRVRNGTDADVATALEAEAAGLRSPPEGPVAKIDWNRHNLALMAEMREGAFLAADAGGMIPK